MSEGEPDAWVNESADEWEIDFDSEDEDWGEKCVCLFCPTEFENVLQHMKDAHNFDFVAVCSTRKDVQSELDAIRLVNITRRAVAAHQCPFPHGHDRVSAGAVQKACAQEVKNFLGQLDSHDSTTSRTMAALEKHWNKNPTHRLPWRLGSEVNDADLVPFLPGDSFLSVIMSSLDDCFARDGKQEEDYAMIPTAAELKQPKS